MSPRGKHGAAAAVRHEVQSAAQQIETYRAAVARLTAELTQSKNDARAEAQRHRQTEKELRARLDVAAAPKIEALEMIIKRRTEERDAARADAKKTRDITEGTFNRVADHFRYKHAMNPEAAVQAAFEMIEPRLAGTRSVDTSASDLKRLSRLPESVRDVVLDRSGRSRTDRLKISPEDQ